MKLDFILNAAHPACKLSEVHFRYSAMVCNLSDNLMAKAAMQGAFQRECGLSIKMSIHTVVFSMEPCLSMMPTI